MILSYEVALNVTSAAGRLSSVSATNRPRPPRALDCRKTLSSSAAPLPSHFPFHRGAPPIAPPSLSGSPEMTKERERERKRRRERPRAVTELGQYGPRRGIRRGGIAVPTSRKNSFPLLNHPQAHSAWRRVPGAPSASARRGKV